MIRAVLFDLDDTLFDHSHCSRAALAGVRGLHPCFDRLAVEELELTHSRILEELHGEVMTGRVPLDLARIERFRRLYEAAGHRADNTLAANAAAAYRARYLAERREVAGARALLAEIRRRARVVVVSNNLLEEQQGKLRHCGLNDYVEALVVSEVVGVAKPDAAIFQAALVRADCTPEEAVMIGDSWQNDILGALAAGIRPIWFNRDARPAPLPEIAVITSLEPTDEVLRRIFSDAV